MTLETLKLMLTAFLTSTFLFWICVIVIHRISVTRTPAPTNTRKVMALPQEVMDVEQAILKAEHERLEEHNLYDFWSFMDDDQRS